MLVQNVVGNRSYSIKVSGDGIFLTLTESRLSMAGAPGPPSSGTATWTSSPWPSSTMPPPPASAVDAAAAAAAAVVAAVVAAAEAAVAASVPLVELSSPVSSSFRTWGFFK